MCCVFLIRRGGGVSRHQTSGAGNQGDGGVFREAAAAAQGYEPRVEQPLKLHVFGQACGKKHFLQLQGKKKKKNPDL